MIDQNNNINDKHIRDLLKWRLLEQAEDDDVLTQKLVDMEAKLAFSEEALYVPSLQKEKELLEKLAKIKPNSIFLKWLLPAVLAVFIIAALLIYNNLSQRSLNASANRIEGQNKNNDLPFVALSDSSKQKENTIIVKDSLEKITQSDTTTTERNEKWMVGDPGIKVDYKTASPKKDSKFVDYDNIPVLTEKQKVENEKQKEKMLKQLMKCDNNYWAIIPTSKEIFPASSIPNTFLMSTTEVTNAQYRVFLYDLLIHDKIEEYIKAVPDSTKWRDKNSYNEPYVRYYFKDAPFSCEENFPDLARAEFAKKKWPKPEWVA